MNCLASIFWEDARVWNFAEQLLVVVLIVTWGDLRDGRNVRGDGCAIGGG